MTQDKALAIMKTGVNVFLTGEPGSGKTYVVNKYVEYLRAHELKVAVTASTGIAATHIGGMTIHSWSGVGIRRELGEMDLIKLKGKRKLVNRARDTDVLVIDEISMLDAMVLESVNTVLKTMREDPRPFGGLQVVLVGDFFQLPPVHQSVKDTPVGRPHHNPLPASSAGQAIKEEGMPSSVRGRLGRGQSNDEGATRFAFTSTAWTESKPVVCYLTEQYRQEDEQFSWLLSSVRSGDNLEEVHAKLLSRKVATSFRNDVAGHTRLFSHNADVDRVNNRKLNQLPGAEQVFLMNSRGRKNLVEGLKKGCLSPERLMLKKGARVMFTKNNYEEGFVNGTLGEIIGFVGENKSDNIKGDNYGYSDEFEESEENDMIFPVVRTNDGRKITTGPMEWTVQDHERVLASITQIPLRLAWAITVHKSQGMTLESAVMDLSGAFEYGQGYVAISRVKSFEGLWLEGINQRALEVHPKVIEADGDFRKASERMLRFLRRYSNEEMRVKHENFIRKCGGNVKETVPKKKQSKKSTYEQTLELYKEGKNIEKIAKVRRLKSGTIVNHLEKLKKNSQLNSAELMRVVPDKLKNDLKRIHYAFDKFNDGRLSPVFELLGGNYDYDDLRLARLVWDST